MSRRLFWLILAFLGFGLIVLSSASVVVSERQFGTPSFYWQHQLLYGIVPGLIVMLVLWRIPYTFWKKAAFPILVGSLALLTLLFVPSLGLQLKGAKSWLSIGGITFQPSEFLKLGLVIYLAAWLGGGAKRLRQWQLGLLPFLVIMALVGGLLVLQPDLGTLGVIVMIAIGMYFIAGAPMKQIGAIVAVTLVLMLGLAAVSPERWSRITTVLNPAADVQGSGWQLNQSLIAIGSGGIWGVGLGQSTQKFGFLPEPIGDSIFAILTEEFGFVGGATVLVLFGLLAFLLIRISRKAPDPFGSLIAGGMMIWILSQAIVNIAAITGIGPLTGIPLPFISYGGTSIVSMLAGLGIVLNIADQCS